MLPEPRADRLDLLLTMSELAAAAVREQSDAPTGTTKRMPHRMKARAWLEDGAVAMEIGSARPTVRREAIDAERGFAIVASITDALSVRGDGDRTLVCARKW